MAEGSWLKCQRQFFAKSEAGKLGAPEKIVNKVIEKYNKFLIKSLVGDSIWEIENLKNTIVEGGPETDAKS